MSVCWSRFTSREKLSVQFGRLAHDDRRKFDAEDDRVMASLGKFASSAYQALAHIEDLKIQVAEREKAEAEVRELARGLEAKIRRLVEANVVGIVMFNLEGAISGANDAFLRMVQYEPRRSCHRSRALDGPHARRMARW